MASTKTGEVETTYPLRAVVRLTGLSPDVLRAWERRHGVVTPTRTPGGTRRYSADDLERLRLLKAAVEAGHRIGKIADWGLDELRQRTANEVPGDHRLAEIIEAVDRLDELTAQRLLSVQLSVLGSAGFAREVALPLVREVGVRWAEGRLGIASEHLATGILRSQLGAALHPTAASIRGPRILFATPSGERHELGLLMAALTALGAGARPLFLGIEIPVEDLLAAVEQSDARAVAVSIVTLPPEQAARTLAALRGGLDEEVALWVGGSGAGGFELPEGCERIDSLERLEQRVGLLDFETPHVG